MSDKCPKCGHMMERFGVVANCTHPDCSYSDDADDLVTDLRRQLAAATERADKAEQERDGAQAACAAFHEAIEQYFDWAGAEHEEGCPEDDTCECAHIEKIRRLNGQNFIGQPLLDELATLKAENARLRALLRAAADEREALEQEPSCCNCHEVVRAENERLRGVLHELAEIWQAVSSADQDWQDEDKISIPLRIVRNAAEAASEKETT